MEFKKKTKFLHFIIIAIFIHSMTVTCSIPVNQICIRLQKIFIYLFECVNHNDELGICLTDLPETVILQPYCNFTNFQIIECQTNIAATKSITPLLDLWQKEATFILLNKDDIFLREFLILVYGISGELMMNSLSLEESEHMRDMVSQILTVYQKIDSLPLEEILNAIDILADEMPYLLEKYELNSSITWQSWFTKYWWAPPIIVGTIIFKIWFQNRLRTHKVNIRDK